LKICQRALYKHLKYHNFKTAYPVRLACMLQKKKHYFKKSMLHNKQCGFELEKIIINEKQKKSFFRRIILLYIFYQFYKIQTF